MWLDSAWAKLELLRKSISFSLGLKDGFLAIFLLVWEEELLELMLNSSVSSFFILSEGGLVRLFITLN